MTDKWGHSIHEYQVFQVHSLSNSRIFSFLPGISLQASFKEGLLPSLILIFFLIFKPLSHFEFILCRVWGSVLTSLIYMQLSSFPNTTCWRDCFFLHCIHLPPSVKINWQLGVWVYFWVLYSIHLSMTYMSIYAITIPFWQLELCSIVWSLGVLHFLVCSFSSGLLW